MKTVAYANTGVCLLLVGFAWACDTSHEASELSVSTAEIIASESPTPADWSIGSKTLGEACEETSECTEHLVCSRGGKGNGTGKECSCFLTGENARNFRRNDNIKGSDLGHPFTFDGRLHFIFGDSNLEEAYARAHLSNVMAVADDLNPNVCPDLRYVTIKDVYANRVDFFAQEASKIAKNSRTCNCNTKNCCSWDRHLHTDTEVHRTWAQGKGARKIREELDRRTRLVLDRLSDADDRSRYFARVGVRMANTGIPMHDNFVGPRNELENIWRNNPFFGEQRAKAEGHSAEWLATEIEQRYRRIIWAISNDLPKQLFASKTFDEELTNIPTHAITVDGTIYVFFKSVADWRFGMNDGEVDIWFSSIATSVDGVTFKRHDNEIKFPGHGLGYSHGSYNQVVPVLKGKYLYLYGVPGGRNGSIRLARVRKDKILKPSAYRYWVGDDRVHTLDSPEAWALRDGDFSGCDSLSSRPQSQIPHDICVLGGRKGTPVVESPSGEFDIVSLGKVSSLRPGSPRSSQEVWALTQMYRDPETASGSIMIRTSSDLIRWSAPVELVKCGGRGGYGACYGGYVHSSLIDPAAVFNSRRSLKVFMSTWAEDKPGKAARYNSYLLKRTISVSAGSPPRLITP